MDKILLDVQDLKKYFPITKGLLGKNIGWVKAVDGVSFQVRRGETLGVVGESGCGKTTMVRSLLQLIEPTSGTVRINLNGQWQVVDRESIKELRSEMQIIFQDPYSSLNPRMRIRDIIAEPLVTHGIGSRSERYEKVASLLKAVGLGTQHMDRYPHEFSGGQRQRIGIARALAINPSLIVCDEPVSALDVSVQAQVLNLLGDLQKDFGLTYIFVAHDLSVVQHISNRVAVMYLGRIVELGDVKQLYVKPKHPYTEALLSAILTPDSTQKAKPIILKGDVPNPANPPQSCAFSPRCDYAIDICAKVRPDLIVSEGDHQVACHRFSELNLAGIELQ